MPDKWGRPTINDGIAIAEGFQSLKRFQNSLEDRAETQQEKQRRLKDAAQIESYSKSLMNGKPLDPKSKDFNAANALAAQAMLFEKQRNDQIFKSKKLQLQKQRYKAEKREMIKGYAAAQVVADSGDEQTAAEMLASKLYKYVPDGGDFKGTDEETGEWLFDDHYTHGVNRMPPVPWKKAKQMAEKFIQMYEGVRTKVRNASDAHNLAEFKKPAEIWTKKGGKGRYAHYVLMDKRGRPRETWVDISSGDIVKGFDPQNPSQEIEFKGELTPPREDKKKGAEKKGLSDKNLSDIRKEALKYSQRVEEQARRTNPPLSEKQIQIAKNKAYREFFQKVSDKAPQNDNTPYMKEVNRLSGISRTLNRYGDVISQSGKKNGTPFWTGRIARP
jgi:hypothetical protein